VNSGLVRTGCPDEWPPKYGLDRDRTNFNNQKRTIRHIGPLPINHGRSEGISLRRQCHLVATTSSGYPPRMQDDALRSLFPTIADDKVRLAAEKLDEYLVLAWEIIEDMEPIRSKLDGPRIPGQDASVWERSDRKCDEQTS